MNVLLIGSGGREAILAQHIATSPLTDQLFYYGDHENPGIRAIYLGPFYDTDPTLDIHLVVIGPERYLEQGLADRFAQLGIPVIGPTQDLARIETSKRFARYIVNKIDSKFNPTCRLIDTDDVHWLNHMVEFTTNHPQYVVKCDGLKGGKGVIVHGDHFNRFEEAVAFMRHNGDRYLLEEKLTGQEFSLISFADGEHVAHCPAVRDYKRRYENDQGPNTGGMGATTYLPWLTQSDIETAQELNRKVLRYLPGYQGILYGGFMKTTDGIRLIEYNARFGDPEIYCILSLLETDLMQIFQAIATQTLDRIDVKFREQYALTRYLVPPAYPGKGVSIDLSKCPVNMPGIYMASVDQEYQTLGSRSIALVTTGSDISQLTKEINQISEQFPELDCRKDIPWTTITYKDAGVNISEGNRLISKLKTIMPSIGGFGGRLTLGDETLICTMDGVGTKTKLTKTGLGYDIVNHCVNDLMVEGGEPLMFLDYFATSKLDADFAFQIIKEIKDACDSANCVLAGGETAEMPDVYLSGEIDLVGCMIGKLKQEPIEIQAGDKIMGWYSNGLHTNGFSLARKVMKFQPKIHRSYHHEVKSLWDNQIAHQLCHITGGGFQDNIARVIPEGLSANIYTDTWQFPEIFQQLQEKTGLSRDQMLNTFNCGVGMLVIARPDRTEQITELVPESFIIGEVTHGTEKVVIH